MVAILVGAVLVFMSIVMAAGWACQRAARNGGWTDVFWTFGTGLAGIAVALAPIEGLGWPTARQIVVALLVAVWSARLGFYIAFRVARSPEDARYKRLRQDWGAGFQRRMFGFLQIQAPATMLLSVSIVMAAHNPQPGLTIRDALGVLILVVAIAGEGLADRQMAAFKRDPSSHGRVCDRGLWGLSRHPNYFFEWFGWLAYPLIAFNATDAHPYWWLAFVGPVVMYLLLDRVTGVPPLEDAMVASKGEAYRAYQGRVSRFFPWPSAGAPA